MSTADIRLRQNISRFEIEVDGHLGELEFEVEDGIASMNHVRVPAEIGGRGIAGQLTRHALEWAEEQGYSVRAECPYVAAWIRRHPEFERLLAKPA